MRHRPVPVVLALGGLLAACAKPDYSVPPERPQCARRAAVDLGVPFVGGRLSEFESRGGEVHIEVSGLDQGGMFEPSVTLVYLGAAARPPRFDAQRGSVSDVLTEVQVRDRSFGTVRLPPGRYWVWSSNGGHLTATSCRAGGVAPAS